MSGSFMVVFLILLVLVVFWRAALVIGLALLLTFVVIGVGGIAQAIENESGGELPTVQSDDPR